jgi:hypothetical protein
MRKRRPIKRDRKSLRDTSLLVIASEDTHAVKQYFDMFRSTRIQYVVLPTADGASSPMHLVERLEKCKKEIDFQSQDQLWLVCDCEHWIEPSHVANFQAMLSLCRQKQFMVAISNPCIEIWFLLHFAGFPDPAVATCREVDELLGVAVGSYNKRRVYKVPFTFDSVSQAVLKAAASPFNMYGIPSTCMTNVYLIVQEMIVKGMWSVEAKGLD